MSLQGNSRERWAVGLLLAAGFFVRIGWLVWRRSLEYAEGEAANIAINLAQHGVFGDPFAKGTGATAHLTPSMSLITTAAYAAFGVRSTAAEAVLAFVSILIVLGAGLIFYLAWRRAGLSALAGLAALAVFCLSPLNLKLETVYFRAWEGGLVVLLLATCLYLAIGVSQLERVRPSSFLVLAFAGALTFFVNPAAGLGAYACIGWLALTRLPIRRWPVTMAIGLVALGIVLAPWTLRNEMVLGKPIFLRSNFGLEFAIANNEAIADSENPRKAFVQRIMAIHPYGMDQAAAQAALRDGEAAYAQRLGDKAMAWARSNPEKFSRLTLWHLREFYFPSAWQWNVYADVSTGTDLKIALTWLLSGIGLIGALLALLAWRGPYIYVALLALVPCLPYTIVQPILRYRYLVLLPLLFLAAEVLRRLAIPAKRWLEQRRSPMLASQPVD
jgi:hypothetical protein